VCVCRSKEKEKKRIITGRGENRNNGIQPKVYDGHRAEML